MLECAAANAAQTKLRATEGAQLRLKTYVMRHWANRLSLKGESTFMQSNQIFRILALLIGLNLPLVAEEGALDKLVSPELNRCLNEAGLVDLQMATCVSREGSDWDSRLNTAYATLSDYMPSEIFSQVRKSQQAWIQFKNATCRHAFDSEGGGTLSHLFEAECILNLTIPRTLELEELLRIWKPSYSSP